MLDVIMIIIIVWKCALIPVFDVNKVTEEKMLRRKPTRLELKIDDTGEFESVKKELEV